MADYVTADTSLPRSLDVQITVSNPQTATRRDLSILCVACESLGLLPDSNRIRIYSDLDGIITDYGTDSEPYRAGAAFFSQSPRAQRMAVGEAFLTAQKAQLVAATYSAADITAIRAITAGNLKLTITSSGSSTAYNLDAMNFSADDTLTKIATRIQGKLTAGSVPATCSVVTYPGGAQKVVIQTTATGDGVSISYPITTGTGTFAGTALKMTAAAGGKALAGYTPTDIAGELQNIQNAANVNGFFVYGWCLEAGLRDPAIQTVAATWALAQALAIMPLVSNDASAPDSSYTSDLGSLLDGTANKRVVPIWHDNAQQYPDVSILAYMLHVNYRAGASVVTAKFKSLPGITTATVTETEYETLREKGYNVYTDMGGDIFTYREGSVPSSGWWMDTVINLDNFVEDLGVNVYNVFLRNKKIPYTRAGQLLLVDACRDTGEQYAFNGTFADREVSDDTQKSGIRIDPAVVVTPTPIEQSTAADRVGRIGPPIQMVVQDSGAIHSIAINVEVVT